MKFNIIEGEYTDFDKIHDDFCEDYLWSNDLSNKEIKQKYGLSAWEFIQFTKQVKKEYGVKRRKKSGMGKYYYKAKYGYTIKKVIDGRQVYFGHVPTVVIAKEIVELCKKAEWDIDVCTEIVENYKKYVN